MTWAPCPHSVRTRGKNCGFVVGFVGFLVVWVCCLLFLFASQPCWKLDLKSTEVTCAKPAHTAPPLVQKKVAMPSTATLTNSCTSYAISCMGCATKRVRAGGKKCLGATGWCVVPPLWEGDQHRFLQHLVQRKHCPLGLGACGCVLLFGFCVLGFGCVLVSPPPTCSVSILLMMTWALRPHGVRTRGKKKHCNRYLCCNLSHLSPRQFSTMHSSR